MKACFGVSSGFTFAWSLLNPFHLLEKRLVYLVLCCRNGTLQISVLTEILQIMHCIFSSPRSFPAAGGRGELEAQKAKTRVWGTHSLLETEKRKGTVTAAILITKVYKRVSDSHAKMLTLELNLTAATQVLLWLGTGISQISGSELAQSWFYCTTLSHWKQPLLTGGSPFSHTWQWCGITSVVLAMSPPGFCKN